jgi:hypothetical protein
LRFAVGFDELVLCGVKVVAEIEIHHEHGHENDSFGKTVGVLVGIIGIVLAAITIASHRAHTAAVIFRTEANDEWSYYQSKKVREHAADNTAIILKLLATDPAKVEPAVAKLKETSDRYAKDTEESEKKAKAKEEDTEHAEHQALRFDLGEGLLELGLVLSSLYFLSKRRVFTYVGVTAAIAGAAVGMSGFLL